MPLKEKGKQKPTRRPLPSLNRDPIAKGVAAGAKVKSKKRSNPGASMLSSRY